MSEASDYQAKLKQEFNQFRNIENVHDLPDIFHYWSNRYLAPSLLAVFETSDPVQIFADVFAQCANASPASVHPTFLSVGSGDCAIEIEIARRLKDLGLQFQIECAELSDVMLDRGRKASVAAGVSEYLLFNEVDINQWRAERKYTAAMANHSLHHIVGLEQVFDEVRGALAPEGKFVISDIIGRNGHMRWPEAEGLLHAIWSRLPNSKKYNHQLRRVEKEFVNWDCSQEGFEGIRAQDILASLIERFDFTRFVAFGNLTDIFVDRSFGHNFDPESPEDRTFIDRVHALNELLIDLGVLKPTMLIATMVPKGEAINPSLCYRNWLPEFCVRASSDGQMNVIGPSHAPAPIVPVSEYADALEVKTRILRLEDGLRQAESARRYCDEQIAELRLSTSWRITAPLRWMKQKLVNPSH